MVWYVVKYGLTIDFALDRGTVSQKPKQVPVPYVYIDNIYCCWNMLLPALFSTKSEKENPLPVYVPL